MAEFEGKPLSEYMELTVTSVNTAPAVLLSPMRYLTESVVLKWDHDFDVVRAKLMVLYLN